MDYSNLKEQWITEEKAAFQGWDFSRLNKRREESPVEWDYIKIVREYLKSDDLLLDMGTGGGEVLLTIKHPYNLTYATEAYEPNFQLCKKTLASLGIHVAKVYGDYNDDLPYENEMFDVVINRHESFDMKEIHRILKPNGFFITQQVGGKNDMNLSDILGYKRYFEHHTLENNIDIIENNGFNVIYKNECFPEVKFFDVGTIVYFAKIIEWEFPGFSVEDYFVKLTDIQKEIESNGFFKNINHRFIIAANKK